MPARSIDGSIDHPEYQSAITLLSYRHICRLEQWPKELSGLTKSSHNSCRDILFGKYMFNCIGSLRNYKRLDYLSNIKIPTLIMHGEYDYISLECAVSMQAALHNAKLALFRNCSHLIYLENPMKYHNVLENFLQKD